MPQQPAVIIYPTTDVEAAKRFYGQLLGVEPYVDSPYYVGFKAGDVEIGLDPNGAARGHTAATAYWNTTDLESAVNALSEIGAELHQPITEVGGGMRIAILRDPSGNLIGLRESAG